MEHIEHIHLIKKAISTTGGVWADFGSGEGAFTLALRDLTGSNVIIYSVDREKERLDAQELQFTKNFPATHIKFIQADFTKQLELPALDGILMANSLHYVQIQRDFLTTLQQKYLKPQGKLVLVEYNIDKSNQWVPYPLSYETFDTLAKQAGFTTVRLLEKIPSTYWEEMYAAEAIK